MLTADVQCLATNPASNCVLTIIEDVSGDVQDSVPNLLLLLNAPQALNKELLSRLIKHILVQPDPSPIEHVWDMTGKRLHLSGNVDNRTQQLEQIWQEIPQGTIRLLYHSMSHRVAACIQARGGSSPY
ncbi:transposable element Tcb1 transposase [Trichonephila clavipes]|nr:transposable element Tcb1 transposase [Trichonephila clavipes]